MQGEVVKVGDSVKVVDEHGKLFNGLCECVHGNPDGAQTCINVVYVSGDDKKTDQYGRQKEHLSSCQHRSLAGAPGRYWYVQE